MYKGISDDEFDNDRLSLSFRGHEKEEGNYYQVMNLQVAIYNDHNIKHWLSSQKYMLQEILNEIIELIAQDLLQLLLSEIQSVPCYALIADETRDIAGFEQLIVSLRWVSDSYVVNEDLIGLIYEC